MDARRSECHENPRNGSFTGKEKFCGLLFDGLLCWPATEAGATALQRCPNVEINHSLIADLQNATKKCEQDGTWYVHPEFNRSWTNYTLCNLAMYDTETAVINFTVAIEDSHLYAVWLPIIKHVSLVGYSVSILTLLFSLAVFTVIKKLQCARNILHMHLFISFIMRAIMFIAKDLILVDGIAMKSDVVMDQGKYYITEHYNWICKAMLSLRWYFTQANYMFILMEGVYLHNLIFLNLFSDKSNIRIYYLLGWGIPLVFVSLWAMLRLEYENTLCWTTSKNQLFPKLIQRPIEASVVINFILFISITRLLCIKINAMYLQQNQVKYRRLIRSTLTLILIYGVPCTISAIVSYTNNMRIELIWICCDQTFTAFQGLLMALIYCLLNGEVRTELKHKYDSLSYNRRQKRHSRTVSNTQFSLPVHDDGSAEPLRVFCQKAVTNL